MPYAATTRDEAQRSIRTYYEAVSRTSSDSRISRFISEGYMHQRRKAREVTLQVLYELDVQGIGVREAIERFWANFDAPEENRKFSTFLIEGAWSNREQIDKLISDNSENWTMARMSRVDKSILRMAVYELLFCNDIPPKVTLNEAIDLGKVYGSENSGAFINGILDALYGKLRKKDEDLDIDSVTGCPGP